MLVTTGVVERLEVIEIDENQGTMQVLPRVGGQCVTEALGEHAPIGQSGQRVEEGEAANLTLGGFLVAHGVLLLLEQQDQPQAEADPLNDDEDDEL